MASSLGQIIFYSMVILIVLIAAIIILILALVFSRTTSEVMSTNTLPIANLSEDVVLSCYLKTKSEQVRQLSVTWEKKDLQGLVYQYKDGVLDLEDQNSQFKQRTELFPNVLDTGNASLLLRGVRSSDEGEYTCSISSSDGGGKVNIHLRTAAFSAPTFKFSDGVLAAEASRWFPKPKVIWSNYDGNILNGSTSFTPSSAGIFSVVSTLQPVSVNNTYTCRIENNLVIAISRAAITGSGVSRNTYFTYSAASSLLASTYLGIMTSVLCSFLT